MFFFLYCNSNINNSSSQQTNNSGNKAAIAALFFSGIFSVILAITIIRSIIQLRESVFPISNTLCIKVSQENITEPISTTRNFQIHNPKLHFYATCVAFILLFIMFSVMTIIFLKAAFDLQSLENGANSYFQKIHKAWSIIPISITILCFLTAVFLVFKLSEDISVLSTKKYFHLTHEQGIKSIKNVYEVKKEYASLKNLALYILEILSILLCIATIVSCIYFTWAIFST